MSDREVEVTLRLHGVDDAAAAASTVVTFLKRASFVVDATSGEIEVDGEEVAVWEPGRLWAGRRSD